jgi:hypothetical protein
MILKLISRASLVLLMGMSCAQATTIDYTATQLGGTRWRYDYTVHNDTLGSPLQDFTIYFNENLFANLANESTQASWDLLLIQPDTNIPAAGFFDGLAPDSGLAFGAWADGFSVSFDYFGTGMPGRQSFSIYETATWGEIEKGMTGTAAVPLPGTLSLLVLGLAAGAVQRRRGGAQ